MNDRLRLDLDAVRETAVNLQNIGRNLEDAESAADELAGMIPHRGLSGAVGTFGKDWDVARTELIGKLEELHQATDGVAQTFEDVDGELAAALEADR